MANLLGTFNADSLFGNSPMEVRDRVRMMNRNRASQFGGWGLLGNFIGERTGLKPGAGSIQAAATMQDRANRMRSIGMELANTYEGGITPANQGEFMGKYGNALIKAGMIDEGLKVMGMGGGVAPIDQKQVNALRSELYKVTGTQRTMEAAIGKIESVGNSETPAGDMALLFSFMKLLDPNSTVREGEYATAANAGSAFERVGSLYNRVLNGQLLTASQRADFLGQSRKLYDSQMESTDKQIGNVLEFGLEDKIPPDRVLGKRRYSKFKARQRKRGKKAPVKEKQERFDESLLEFMTPEERALFK